MEDHAAPHAGLQRQRQAGRLQEHKTGGKSGPAVLLVEREDEYAALIEALVRRRGGAVERVDPAGAPDAARRRAYALGVIDSEAEADGHRSVLRTLREDPQTASLPLIALSHAEPSEDAVVRVMERADYELVKPFSPRRFWAAVRVVVGRAGAAVPDDAPAAQAARDEQTVGPLTLRHRLLAAQIDGQQVSLSPREFSLLYVLASHPGVAFTRDELARRAWGWQPAGDSRAVDNMVRRLRRKLGDDGREPQLLRTERGVGYRLALP